MTWRKRLFAVLGTAVLVLCSFVLGFYASLHLKHTTAADVRERYLRPEGDAPPAVRSGVRIALKAFQDGYNKRDPKQLDAFMAQLFAKDSDVLLLGTDSDEWARGYSAVRQFIETDWTQWGQFKFEVDDAIISSAGDVAWATSVGEVVSGPSAHAVRFSAILVRRGNSWIFRQLQFQWDERDPAPAELLRASTQVQIVRLFLKKAQDMARSTVKVFAVQTAVPTAAHRVQVSDAEPTSPGKASMGGAAPMD
ncbi:MAG TPA: nuclear transport factor 2 family protein [candidate division Zixibacteria bacterium]|nr:nuclear transport factor 2 family protein [candidate division Zixibacteria bacterium]